MKLKELLQYFTTESKLSIKVIGDGGILNAEALTLYDNMGEDISGSLGNLEVVSIQHTPSFIQIIVIDI